MKAKAEARNISMDAIRLALELSGVRNRIIVNKKDCSILAHVPVGLFEMGDGTDSDCPKHRVELSEYWIGVNCVSNAQYAAYCKVAGESIPHFSSHEEMHPVVNVSWDDATAYAEWAGCQLPTEAQWEKAAKGPLGLMYPWGNIWSGDRCRNEKNRGREGSVPVSAHPEGASGYGTYQQTGNVEEWCRDWYDEWYYRKSPAKDPGGPSFGSARVLRGGSWLNCSDYSGRTADRTSIDPDHSWDDRGFRLVRAGTRRRKVEG